jgi:hypothetical protein
VIIELIVEPCLGEAEYVKIGGANIVIKFKLFGPETSNVLVVNAKTVAEIYT